MLFPDEHPINRETQRSTPAFFVKLFLFLISFQAAPNHTRVSVLVLYRHVSPCTSHVYQWHVHSHSRGF